MREYNISDKSKYYRQNNNEIKPGIRCKPTAVTEALDLAGWPLPSGNRKQPEDNLTEYMEKTFGPDSPEDWRFIRQAINDYFLPGSGAVIGPRFDWMIREALFGITRGLPFVASTWLTKTGHIVNIVGYVTEEEILPKTWQEIDFDKVTEIIIDDPYGDRTSGKYETGKSGFNNRYPKRTFAADIWRATGIQIRKKG